MSLKVKFLAVAIIIVGSAGSTHVATMAQGLKGAQMPKKILGRLTYIKGNNDRERWKTFFDIQPDLIGMSYEMVQKRLGEEPIGAHDRSSVEYGLTQNPVKSGTKRNSWLHVHLSFRNGVVWKYSVEADNY